MKINLSDSSDMYECEINTKHMCVDITELHGQFILTNDADEMLIISSSGEGFEISYSRNLNASHGQETTPFSCPTLKFDNGVIGVKGEVIG